ncbi:ABC transporter ATP-binding protein [Tepiditoga spiralis]|uniref:ABC transporter ATP-binding protein n=1 Tax=Tepiditoga spiralis TaxID=2108365 RepID=A0A7G1GAI1_9BACT|nr:ABC transporter ATP-binding protein [Tepiditoga spiralis]BBE32157.1 ABC transporter ATP-binding protein [Tepiditoga spiralis]
MASSYENILKEENEKGLSDRHTFKKLWEYIKKYKLILVIAFVSLFFSTIIDLNIPRIIKFGIDNVISSEKTYIKNKDNTFIESEKGDYKLTYTDNSYYFIKDNTKIKASENQVQKDQKTKIDKLSFFTIIVLLILILQLFTNYGQVYFSNLLGQKVVYDIRKKMFEQINKTKFEFFTKNPSGKITTRVVNDTQNLSDFFTDVMTSLIKDIAIIVGVIYFMFVYLNVKLSLYTMITFPIVLISMFLFKTLDRKAYNKVRTRISALNSYLAENISGSLVTKLFNQEQRKKDEFQSMNKKLHKARMQQLLIYAIFRPAMNLLYYLTISTILWVGSKEIKNDFISFGTLYAFIAYIDMFFKPLFDIAEKYDIMQNAFSSAGKIFKIMDEEKEDIGKGQIKTLKNGNIEFDNIKFSYSHDNNYVLKGVTFNIKDNERVSIVGETGSGKSTIIKLMNGLYKFNEGNIKIGNENLYEYDLNYLRKKIAVVPQDVYLFTGNIIENIRLFNENISIEQVKSAAKMVYAEEIIKKFPDAYETKILERGSTLSAGEKQLIALARAVIFNSKIIILDEATANIDVETEHLIQKALNDLSKTTTIVSIAHRLSTVKNSERIIVIHKGLAVEEGTHQDLLNKKGIYYDLYRLQFENI